MYTLTQNRKILLSAAMLFVLSFSVMIFFLQKYSHDLDHGQADVLNHGAAGEEAVEHSDDPWAEYLVDGETTFVTTPDGHLSYASDSFARMLGLGENYKDELLFEFLESKDLSILVNAQTELIQSRESKDTIGPIQMKNGKKEVLVFLNADPVLGEDDRVEYIVFTVYDLTEKMDSLKEKDEEKAEGSSEGTVPRIEELPDDGHHRFTVEKIGYKAE